MTYEIDKLTNKLKLVPQSWYAWQRIPGLGGLRGDNLNCFLILSVHSPDPSGTLPCLRQAGKGL
jgi:hypothetical protein